MFTGLIEEVGKVKNIAKGLKSIRLTIGATKVLEDVKLGDSIATNGVCLTVTSFTATEFTADVMPETIKVSNLNDISVGDAVNLERALRLGDRLGGHMVSGHIDCMGKIVAFEKDDNATLVTIEPPSSFLPYVLHKGSVAIDGISLTVAGLDATTFTVSIIPMTKDDTTLLSKKSGMKVNLEGDLMGKYVERFMQLGLSPANQNSSGIKSDEDASASYEHSMAFLRDNGFA